MDAFDLGQLVARVNTLETQYKAIDAKLNAMIGGGAFQLIIWVAFLVWQQIGMKH